MRRQGYKLGLGLLILFGLGGCEASDEPIQEDSGASSSSTDTHQISSTTIESTKEVVESTSSSNELMETTSSETTTQVSDREKIESLPVKVQAQLYAQTTDSRMVEYAGLERMTLFYDIQGDDMYVFLTSGAGTGHPVYHMKKTSHGIEPLQGVYYSGIDGYLETPVTSQEVPYETLYAYYEENSGLLEQGEANVKEDPQLAATFSEYLDYAGIEMIH